MLEIGYLKFDIGYSLLYSIEAKEEREKWG